MKLYKKIILGSLTALLFTNNVLANETLLSHADITQHLNTHLNLEIQDMTGQNIQHAVSVQLNRATLELETNQLVARAGNDIEAHSVKVVLAD